MINHFQALLSISTLVLPPYSMEGVRFIVPVPGGPDAPVVGNATTSSTGFS